MPRRLPAALVAGLLCAAVGASAAAAQSVSSPPDLGAHVAAARTRAHALSTEVADIFAQTGGVKVAQLFGESDEEKAARLQREQAQDSSITNLNQRVGDLEDTLRRLTGQVEELDHRVGELGERMAHMRKDFDYKLCALAAQQLGASTNPGDENALPCNGAGQQTGMNAPVPGIGATSATAPGAPIHLAPPPGILGTLPRGDLGNLPQQSEAVPNRMASLDARPQFEAALNLLAKAQYDEARAAFRGFADSWPQDDLAPQAVYWVGDISYVQRDYAGAARAFAEELKKYPMSERAPESMLKLGQSLIAMDQKKEGCRALGTLPNEYPSASKSITDQALAARKTAGCR
ncbi:MAG: tol-pal system protein YbgF [Rhizomicrobium sp.]